MSEPSKAGDGSLERLREEATEDVVKEQVSTSEKVAEIAKQDPQNDDTNPN